jgi:hypothetical protein
MAPPKSPVAKDLVHEQGVGATFFLKIKGAAPDRGRHAGGPGSSTHSNSAVTRGRGTTLLCVTFNGAEFLASGYLKIADRGGQAIIPGPESGKNFLADAIA